MRSNQLISTARKLRAYIEDNAMSLSDEQALDIPEAFPNWASGKSYEIGERVRYGEKLYKCIQAHSAQADWTPDVVPALWVEVSPEGVIPAWHQPTGAHDAYNTGDKVMYGGQKYISTIDANIWPPDVTGWELLEG